MIAVTVFPFRIVSTRSRSPSRNCLAFTSASSREAAITSTASCQSGCCPRYFAKLPLRTYQYDNTLLFPPSRLVAQQHGYTYAESGGDLLQKRK